MAIARQIRLGAKPVRVAMKGAKTLVANRGTVQCLLAPNDGLSANSDQVAVLDAGGTLTLDGREDWWGISATGSGGLVHSIPGASAATASPAAIAAAI